MFVVRELDCELALFFRLRSLISTIWFAESEPHIFARRGAHVTDRADRRTGSGECLPREKLLTMAAYTRIVIGKIRRVGKVSLRRPRGWDLMTGIARETLVLFGRVEKRRILGSRSARNWLHGRRRFGSAPRMAGLRAS